MMFGIADLTRSFPGFTLGPLSLQVEEGEYFVLLGPSGVGKSLLLELLAGMEPVESGTLLLGGRDITSLPIQKRNIGLVFQKPALFPHLTVFANIAYGLRGVPRATRKARVLTLAQKVGVEPLLHRLPGTLSGGEAQRVALARMLAVEPKILCLDEPLSSLDRELREGLKTLLRELNREGQTILHVTHDYEEALSLASRVGVLERRGERTQLTQVGTPRELFQSPRSPFVARFMGWQNVLPGTFLEGKRFRPVGGEEVSFLLEAPSGVTGEGFVVVDPAAIIVGPAAPTTNHFTGVVVDLAPRLKGVEMTLLAQNLRFIVLLGEEQWAALEGNLGGQLEFGFAPGSVAAYSGSPQKGGRGAAPREGVRC